MARTEALKKLQHTLTARRNELRRRLGSELASLGTSGSPDTGVVALNSADVEMSSQLAELESREMTQIETALARLKQGKYGLCAGCEAKIPVARLNALPYSTLCIACQREVEKDSSWLQDRMTENWGDVSDSGESEVNIKDIEYNYSR